MSPECLLCSNACLDADFTALLDLRLRWLWEQVAAAADRRGDPRLDSGWLRVIAPSPPDWRAAALGLLGGRPLSAGQRRRVDLGELTGRLRTRGRALTPAAVAAHALGRPLAARAQARARRDHAERDLLAVLERGLPDIRALAVPDITAREIFDCLRRNGWVARLAAAPNGPAQLHTALAVTAALPLPDPMSTGDAGRSPDRTGACRVDRRVLAQRAAGHPHALDPGTALAGLVVTLLTAAGVTPPGSRPREVWDGVGVDYDEVTGGLTMVGIAPLGWSVPRGAMVTVPPRELAFCRWPAPPEPGRWVFVTENPSVAAAAADLDAAEPVSGTAGAAREAQMPVRLVCTSGTPSACEIAAVARIAAAGWGVAVRADFDGAGLANVTALLKAVPGAVPWRMGVIDYEDSLAAGGARLPDAVQPSTFWDLGLAECIVETGTVTYEESLLDDLLDDLRHGRPDRHR